MSLIINYFFIIPIFWNRNKKYYLCQYENNKILKINPNKYTQTVKIPDIYKYKRDLIFTKN